MTFRVPLSSVADSLDTRPTPATAGVRVYETGDANGRWGVVEFADPAADVPASLTSRINAGSGGSVQGSLLALKGMAANGKAAPELDLTIEAAPTSGYWRVARLAADFLALPGDAPDAAVTYGPGVTAFTDSTGWNGLRCWKRSSVVTIAGAIKLTATVANNGVIATLPAGFAPPEKLQTNVDNSTAVTVAVQPSGAVTLSPSQVSGYVASFQLTYAVTS